jgi:hypothetical protein
MFAEEMRSMMKTNDDYLASWIDHDDRFGMVAAFFQMIPYSLSQSTQKRLDFFSVC